MDPYAADAAWYDLIHAGFDEDIGLWQSFAGRTDRPVLEVGCGSGRVAIPLARAGAKVTGVDPSAAMLERARARAAGEGVALDLRPGRLPGVALPGEQFGFVLLANGAFLYCEDGEAQLALLREVARLLAFDGVVAIDLPGPAAGLDPALNGQPVLVYEGDDGEGGLLFCWHVCEDDLAEQRRRLRVLYERVAGDGTVRRFQSLHHLRYVQRFEMEYLLHLAGLALLDIYGDYELGPLENGSSRMIVTARRVLG